MRTSKKRQRRRRTCDLGASGENIIGYCTLHKCCMSKKQMPVSTSKIYFAGIVLFLRFTRAILKPLNYLYTFAFSV